MKKGMQLTILEKVAHETQARPFSIHHTHVEGDNTNALYLHCHPEAEFFYLEEGELSFSVEDRNYILRAGDAVLIPPQLVHHASKVLGEECTYGALVFSVEWLSGYCGKEGNLYLNTLLKMPYDWIRVFRAGEPEDAEMLRRLSHFADYRGMPLEQYEMKLLGELLISFQEIYNAVLEKMRYNDKIDVLQENLQKGIAYVNAHFREALSLAELAEAAGYSESHFCHRFKEVTGYTPFAYLNRIRVIKASEELLTTEDKITEIAGRCGFDNISYFNRVFRREMGVSPGEYRRGAR